MMPDLEQIYNEYHGKVMGYIRARISRWVEAEDLCADVFEKVQRKLDAERTGRSAARPAGGTAGYYCSPVL